MKLRVLTENPITIMEYKRVVDLVKSSKALDKDLYTLFPERYKGISYKGKKAIVIYFDKKEASSHKYETKVELGINICI